MKKVLAAALSALMILSATALLSGCGEENQNQSQSSFSDSANKEADKDPKDAIIGTWGGRSDKTEVKFNDDGTCEIGGVTGNYTIDDKNTLTVTPKEGDSQVFTWVETADGIQSDEWTISDGKIYINGYQYTNTLINSNENNSSSSQSSSSGSSNSSVNSNSGSAVLNSNSSSNSSSSKPQSSQNSSSSSPNSSSGNSSSNTSSQPATAPTYEQGGANDEKPIPEYIDDLDED